MDSLEEKEFDISDPSGSNLERFHLGIERFGRRIRAPVDKEIKDCLLS